MKPLIAKKKKLCHQKKSDHTKVQGNKIVDSPELTGPNYSHLLIYLSLLTFVL